MLSSDIDYYNVVGKRLSLCLHGKITIDNFMDGSATLGK